MLRIEEELLEDTIETDYIIFSLTSTFIEEDIDSELLSQLDSEIYEEFLKSLHLQRQEFLFIKNLCDIYNSPLSPLRALTAEEKEIIKLFNPSAVAALKPCVITGGELVALGLKGAAINKALTFAATAQREGKIKTKAAALKLLKQNNLI